jgi:hypothetical protein
VVDDHRRELGKVFTALDQYFDVDIGRTAIFFSILGGLY